MIFYIQQNISGNETPEKEEKLGQTKHGGKSTLVLGKTYLAKLGNKTIILSPGEFKVGNRIIKRVPKALYCFTNTNPVRKASAVISEHKAFDIFIILCIFANMITMASRDYINKNKDSSRNEILD